jgi:uncharacterized protein
LEDALPRVTHFEFSADDPTRCITFYERAFGWRFEKWDGPMPYWMIKTGDGPGIDGGMGPRQQPGQPPAHVVDVPSLADTRKKVLDAGGIEVVPKMAIPGVGWLAYFADTEKNVFGVMQFDEKAA